MRNKRRSILCIGVAFVMLFLLASCAQELDMRPSEIGTRIKEAYGRLPACVVYDSNAREGEDGYLSEERFNLLLNAEKLVPYTVTEAYVCMSGNPVLCEEIMVFRCRTASDAKDVASLCLSRAKTLDKAEEKPIPCAALCRGKTVIYYRLANGTAAKKAFERVVGDS